MSRPHSVDLPFQAASKQALFPVPSLQVLSPTAAILIMQPPRPLRGTITSTLAINITTTIPTIVCETYEATAHLVINCHHSITSLPRRTITSRH